jgi:serine protease Do
MAAEVPRTGGIAMKKRVIGEVAAVMLIVAAFVSATTLSAQRQGPRAAQPQFDILTLEGPGSSIGVSVREMTADDAAKAKVQVSDGVMIEEVRDGTPASRAGLKPGDVVVEFDGERPRSLRHFSRLVRETAPGRSVKMAIIRDGSRRTIDIAPEGARRLPNPDTVWRALPRDFQFDFDGNAFNLFGGALGSSGRLGVSVTPLSEQLASYFGVTDGVLVSEVRADTPASAAGLKAGDVITSVNGHAVRDPRDVVNEIRDAQSGGSVDLKITRDRKELSLKATFPERRRQTAFWNRRSI